MEVVQEELVDFSKEQSDQIILLCNRLINAHSLNETIGGIKKDVRQMVKDLESIGETTKKELVKMGKV